MESVGIRRNPYSEQCDVMWNKDKFKKVKAEYRGDYIYGRGIEMIECKTLDESYGLTYTPSDHLPLTLEFNLQ